VTCLKNSRATSHFFWLSASVPFSKRNRSGWDVPGGAARRPVVAQPLAPPTTMAASTTHSHPTDGRKTEPAAFGSLFGSFAWIPNQGRTRCVSLIRYRVTIGILGRVLPRDRPSARIRGRRARARYRRRYGAYRPFVPCPH